MFLSARPEEEHHEFLLQTGRTAEIGAKQQHQISWRVESLDDVLKFYKRSQELGIDVQQDVTHGNAFGIYFFDPEGNRNEVYLRSDKDVRQPFRKTLISTSRLKRSMRSPNCWCRTGRPTISRFSRRLQHG